MSNIKNPKTEGFEDFELFDTSDTEEDDNEIGSRWMEHGGKEYKFVFKDPYGHCFVQVKKGRVPDDLNGAYTSVQEAERAVYQYHSRIDAAAEKARLHNTKKADK